MDANAGPHQLSGTITSGDGRGQSLEPLDTSTPHSARMYDYFLGGKDHFTVDRQAADEVIKWFPTIRVTARHNREFMRRATQYLASQQGIRQFLDIGTGIPTPPNLHQVAQEIVPEARVVYVDNDPMVLSHARALMIGTPQGRTEYVQADVRRPQEILSAPQLRSGLDLAEPVGLSLVALLHFIPDDTCYDIVDTLLDAVAPGSFLVMSHVTADFNPDMDRVTQTYRDKGVPAVTRTRDEFARFFRNIELVAPHITGPHRWHAETAPSPQMDAEISMYAAVARKPVIGRYI